MGVAEKRKLNKWLLLILAVLIICAATVIFISFPNRHDTTLSESEGDAIFDICGVSISDFNDISTDMMTKERSAKFPAVTKVYKCWDLYAFILNPIAYNGPVTLALVIDGNSGMSAGMRIVSHAETPHYVRDMESSWFIDRFSGKSVLEYLKPVHLKASANNEIVAITGATVTTEGIINGINAAFGAYREYTSGEPAADVPYMVRFEPGKGDGPAETGSLAFRAYGVILAEVSLEEIRALPSVKRTMSIHSTAGVTSHAFRGTLLSNVLNLVDPRLMDQYSRALAVGVDDFISGVGMEEIRAENNVFVMYEDNGEPLLRKNGEPGGMRIVVMDDLFGQRFTNFLLEIVLETEANY